jgi:MoxR-like ATPase
MKKPARAFRFVGHGGSEELNGRLSEINPFENRIGPWIQSEGHKPEDDETVMGHPAGYIAHEHLVEAVNTALILGKPLLLTGNPGTGKSELAERLAWELNLGPVLRFEAQSTSEANDLFYRFDLVGQMAANQLVQQKQLQLDQASARNFLSFGPLGKAILAADPKAKPKLFERAFPDTPDTPDTSRKPRPSVVLIDEIDKTSRDFPNDLLNGIDRLSFEIREINERITLVEDEALRPIVIITSNSERDLPDPFLRRCTYHHIGDPDPDLLRKILINRVFGGSGSPSDPGTLPLLYEDLLGIFRELRDGSASQYFYTPGTSELIDWTQALVHLDVDAEKGLLDNLSIVQKTISCVTKHRDDRSELRKKFEDLQPSKLAEGIQPSAA